MPGSATLSIIRRYGHFLQHLWLQRPGLNKRDCYRAFLLILCLPPFLVMQLLHGLAWRLDDLFFPRWRQQPVRHPLFIVGPPRTGTTLAHRVIAQDKQFSTFATWECLLAPAAVEKWLCLRLMVLDRRLGRPLSRFFQCLEKHLARRMDRVHAVRWQEPEEDYFVFLPQLTWFLLILPFPRWETAWRFARGDTDLKPEERQELMFYYRACLQKHLLVRGRDRTMLVKNPTFSGMVSSLRDQFPEARFLCCLRDPVETVPSQLSSLQDGLRLFRRNLSEDRLQQRLIELLAFYYDHLLEQLPPHTPEVFWLSLPDARADLAGTLAQAYHQLGYPLRPGFIATLKQQVTACRSYQSGHGYALVQYGLTRSTLQNEFASIYAAYDFQKCAWK